MDIVCLVPFRHNVKYTWYLTLSFSDASIYRYRRCLQAETCHVHFFKICHLKLLCCTSANAYLLTNYTGIICGCSNIYIYILLIQCIWIRGNNYLKSPFPCGDPGPHLTSDSFGPPECTTQTASPFVWPFLQGSQLCPAGRQTDHATLIAGGDIFALSACHAA